jgi:hypothetical protein
MDLRLKSLSIKLHSKLIEIKKNVKWKEPFSELPVFMQYFV